jgi:hypothetical protein
MAPGLHRCRKGVHTGRGLVRSQSSPNAHAGLQSDMPADVCLGQTVEQRSQKVDEQLDGGDGVGAAAEDGGRSHLQSIDASSGQRRVVTGSQRLYYGMTS